MATKTKVFWAIFAVMILCGLAYALPPVQSQFSFNYNQLPTSFHNAFFPSNQETLNAETQTSGTPLPGESTETPEGGIAATQTAPVVSPTPQVTATSLPDSVALKGVKYVDQHGLWNAAPADSLAMQLSFWGWTGTVDSIEQIVRPYTEDYNVMPYELVDFVTSQTNLSVLTRAGGNLDVLKRLVAAGYVVLVEKGINVQGAAAGKSSWTAHYDVISGYNDTAQEVIAQDSAYPPDLHIKYDALIEEWRPFNYTFLVVYPSENEKALMSALGEYADEGNSYRDAYTLATQELNSLSGIDAFFAYFNRGSSQVYLQDYTGAADSYDQAFALYAKLPPDTQPFRMMWYQTGPYYAYFYMFRYTDLIDLADQTIKSTDKPYLEESYYWRGRAERANGDTNSDIADQRLALKYHPGFKPSQDELAQLGINQ